MNVVVEILIDGSFMMAKAAFLVFFIEVIFRKEAVWYTMLAAAAISYLMGVLLEAGHKAYFIKIGRRKRGMQ